MSLRLRLLLGLGLIAVGLLSVATFVLLSTRNSVYEQVDERLATFGKRDTGGFEGGPPNGSTKPPDGVFGDRLSDVYEGSISSDGVLNTYFEPNVPGEEYGVPKLDADDFVLKDGQVRLVTVDSQKSGVQYRVQVRSQSDGTSSVTAVDLKSADNSLSRLLVAELIGLGISFGLLGLVAWWMVRLGIRPVVQMTDTARKIADGDLSSRVPEGAPSTESGQLATALNTMLGRIEESTAERAAAEQRLRRFVADASHELRTPITTIRGYAELYSMGALSEQAELDDAMRRTQEEVGRMGRMVEDMLNLAKLDEERPLLLSNVDLASLARDAAADLLVVEPERSVVVEAPESLVATGDSDRLRQVLANLVGNARVHTPETATISVRVRAEGSDAVLEVADDGPGMSADDAQRATERFYRADPSRVRSKGGSGLGMSIVEAIVRAHHGRVEVDSQLGVGTTVRCVIPFGAAVESAAD